MAKKQRWTPDLLFIYFSKAINDLDKSFNRILKERDKALREKDRTTNSRLLGMNEFREENRKRTIEFATKVQVAGLEKEIETLKKVIADEAIRRASVRNAWTLIVSVAGVAASAVVVIAFLVR